MIVVFTSYREKMKTISKMTVLKLLIYVLGLFMITALLTKSSTTYENKILFEYEQFGSINVVDNIEAMPIDVYQEENEFLMQIMFDYEHYNDYRRSKH